MKKAIKIENWSCIGDINPYHTPEQKDLRLAGDVKDHPKLGCGTIHTSSIIKTEEKKVTTHSGSVYLLGKINPNYKKWIDENYPNWNPENPIKMI